jgi:hypothetical protein
MKRRGFLWTYFGAGISIIGGCTSNPADGTDTSAIQTAPDDTNTESDTLKPKITKRNTFKIILEPPGIPKPGSQLLVYPRDLRRWIREAAKSNTKIRTHTEIPVRGRSPLLPEFEHVRLINAGDLDGWYDSNSTGGVRYRYYAEANEVEPPEGVEVVAVHNLDEAKRELITAAIQNEAYNDVEWLYPETELGEWARNDAFNGYYRFNGSVYQVNENHLTDAAYGSNEIWYILSLSRSDKNNGYKLDFRDISTIRPTLDKLMQINKEFMRTRRPEQRVGETDASNELFYIAKNIDYILTHGAAFKITLER